MKLPQVRFTVWQLMIAVAIVALLIPFPEELAYRIGETIVGVWIPAIGLQMLVDQFVGRGRAARIAFAFVVGAFSSILLPCQRDLDGFSIAVLIGSHCDPGRLWFTA
jgi:hypothetical protein